MSHSPITPSAPPTTSPAVLGEPVAAGRATWGSRLGFVLAAAGSAVGLGAVWKFPYVVGAHGGGAFLVLYLGCVLTLGVALLLAEMTIGRLTGKSVTTALRELGGRRWAWVGRVATFNAFAILSFYVVVGGWTVAYLKRAVTGDVLAVDTERLVSEFSAFIADPVASLVSMGVFLGLTCIIVAAGVQKGIERAGKWLMPALFLLMLLVIARALTLPGAMAGVAWFLTPDFSVISGSTLLEALGLAFFSLSLGAGMIVVYGSYLPKDAKLAGSAVWVATLATLACFLAGLMILPAVFAFGVAPNAGPGLTFITMPAIFAQMPFGHLVAVAFFLLLLFAALTSAVSLFEPVTAFLIDEYQWRRVPAVGAVLVTTFLFGAPAALSFGVWSDVRLFDRTIFDLMDYVTVNLLMPAGGLCVALFVGARIWPSARAVLVGTRGQWFVPVWRALLLILTPVAIFGVWYQSL
ncbi:sodium-dependent transporter [Pandoraea horticolens]|uniref:Transporter n=1 Tax=Pandoraea horticolens TaxID=2508298 RepID=A0A5E4XG54_9BURK|nr:sodium-dependent transporter [Pandoraea horticolens]VVE35364.1 sodium-dependent transporter [Pandoraea horticolens]